MVRVELTQEQIERLVAAYRETLELLSRYDRFADSDERRDVGLRIDPSTAEVFFIYGEVGNPYGDHEVDPAESCWGPQFFAFDPRERVAVHFWDLPEETERLLEAKQRKANAEGWRLLGS